MKKFIATIGFAVRELNGINLKDDIRENAYFMALNSMVMELGENAGIPKDEMIKHYNLRCTWWLDYYMKLHEAHDPGAAGLVDDRTEEEAGIEGSYPPIFGPQS